MNTNPPTITYTLLPRSSDGMTIRELHERLGEILEMGADGEQLVRVRTRFSLSWCGAPVRAVRYVVARTLR
jgi:hypothetical protein